jgi:hypothetical protein
VHAVADEHETLVKESSVAPAGFGVASIDQRVPFQASVNVRRPELVKSNPTAVHAVAEVHDTPCKPLSVAPVGFGVDWIDHFVPFQVSASVT